MVWYVGNRKRQDVPSEHTRTVSERWYVGRVGKTERRKDSAESVRLKKKGMCWKLGKDESREEGKGARN